MNKIKSLSNNKWQTVNGHRVWTEYEIRNRSTQAELRLEARWVIEMAVDQINYPKALSPEGQAVWEELNRLTAEITAAARVSSQVRKISAKISAKTKSGPAQRVEAETKFTRDAGRESLADYRKITGIRNLDRVRKQIAALQAAQQPLLAQLRRANSAYTLACRSAKNAERTALAAGRFWEAGQDLLKSYFTPPFSKNYLADVSERWRAALFLEVEVQNYHGYNELAPTDRGYLCGIDDNGDEWGFRVEGPWSYRTTVERAMALVFGVSPQELENCYRQGDLLFCPVAEIPAEVELVSQTAPWVVMESHRVSAGIERNGHFFRSDREITVSHTSHAPLVLPAGNYRLYTAEVAD